MDRKFPEFRTSIADEDHLGLPASSQVAGSVEQCNALVQEERQIAVADIAEKLDISCEATYFITHRDLRYYHNIYARWVSEKLTVEHK